MTDPASSNSDEPTNSSSNSNSNTEDTHGLVGKAPNLGTFEFAGSTHPSAKKDIFCRTMPKKLTELLSKLTCMKCSALFSKDNLPVIASSGHIVCKNQEKCSNNKPADNTRDTRGNPQIELKDEGLEDKILNEFFEAISHKGIECTGCQEFHPRNNLVHCDGIGFVCVWCAAQKELYKDKHLDTVSEETIKKYCPDGKKRRTLQSVDVTQNAAGWAMHQCCACRKDLYPISKKSLPMSAHFECGHIGHKKCFEKIKFTNSEKCLLCSKTYKKSEELRNPNVREYVSKMGVDDRTTNRCRECDLPHPVSNCIVKKRLLFWHKYKCVWCTVAKNENKRREKNSVTSSSN